MSTGVRLSIAVVAAWAIVATMAAALPSGDAGASANEYQVVDVRVVTTGGRVDWSHDGQWIYFDDKDSDGLWDVYRIRPDGSDRECLTCDHPQLPNRQQGQPEAHPGGRYVIFQAEKGFHRAPDHGTLPGGGHYNDLWALDLLTDDAYRLTNVPWYRFSGSLHPQFNSDGTKLLWTDLEGWGGRFGDWQLVVADFVASPTPRLENHEFYNPGPQPVWLESHGWGPDDSWIYFTCAAVPGMNENNMDICRMDFSSPTEVTRLTFSSGVGGEPGEWDEHAHLSPLGDVFSWTPSNGYGTEDNREYWRWLRTEAWLMNVDASGPRQMTDLNGAGGQDLILRDNDWNRAAIGNQELVISLHDKATRLGYVLIIEFSVNGDAEVLAAESPAAADPRQGARRRRAV